MRPGQGKNKGSSFERAVGAKLSLWLSSGKRKDLLCRTVGSGAQFTFSKASLGNPGDLMAQDPIAYEFISKIVIECKHWRSLDLIKFLNKKGDLYKAMLKVEKEAKSAGKESWWLIAKQNNQPTLLLMPDDGQELGMTEIVYHKLFNDSVLLYQFEHYLETHPITNLSESEKEGWENADPPPPAPISGT